MKSNSRMRLWEIVSSQQGYFTAKQAKDAGYDPRNHAYHVRAGHWIREHRGIYRLALYPSADRPDLVMRSLWSCDQRGRPQGVYSHETALSIHDISDLMHSKLHMTVPPGFRRSAPIPEILRLHRGELLEEDIEVGDGYRITNLAKSFADLLAGDGGFADRDHLIRGMAEALERGRIQRLTVVDSKRFSSSDKEKQLRLIDDARSWLNTANMRKLNW